MAPVTFSVPHSLGAEAAKQRLDRGVTSLRNRYEQHVSSCDVTWEGYTMQVQVGVLKQVVNATCELSDTNAVVSVQLPWMLAPFAGKIQEVLTKEMPKALAPPRQA